MRRSICFALLTSFYLSGIALADERVTNTVQRTDVRGDGDEEAPRVTVSHNPFYQPDKSIEVYVDAIDNSGVPPFCTFLLNGQAMWSQGRPPYLGIFGADLHKNQPASIDVRCSDEYGNTTTARLSSISSAPISCTAKLAASDGDDDTDANSAVTITKSVDVSRDSATTLSVSYTADNSETAEEDEASASAALTVSGTTVSGTLSFTADDVTTTVTVTGTVTVDGAGRVTKVDVSGSNPTASLSCS